MHNILSSSPLNVYSRDTGLNLRIILSFAVLAMLYLVFIGVLMYLGVGFIPVAAVAAIMILAQYYFSDRIVMWSSGAKMVTREQEPKLYSTIEKVALQAGLPMPKVAVMNSAVPNAFATGKSQKNSVVAVTSGLMSILDESELEGVVAHELAHIKNRDVLVLTLASLFSTVAFFLMRYALFGSMYGGRGRDNASGMIIVLVVAGITWFVSFLIIRAVSRYREFAADSGGAQMTGRPDMLASALLKISGRMKAVSQKQKMDVESLNQFFIIPALSGDVLSKLFSTHPPVEERVRRLREMQSLLK